MVRHSKPTGSHKKYNQDQKEAALELCKTKNVTQVSLVSLVSLVDSLSQRLMLFAQDSGATP